MSTSNFIDPSDFAGFYDDNSQDNEQTTIPETPAFGLVLPTNASMAQRRMIGSYTLSLPKQLQNFKGSDLTIIGVVHFPDVFRDETGRVVTIVDNQTGEETQKAGTRCIFKTLEHGLLSTMSVYIAQWVPDFIRLFGINGQMGDLIEPVRVRVEPRQTANKKQSYGFSLLD